MKCPEEPLSYLRRALRSCRVGVEIDVDETLLTAAALTRVFEIVSLRAVPWPIYRRNASLVHLPRVIICESSKPCATASCAAPLLKECPEKLVGSRPARRMHS